MQMGTVAIPAFVGAFRVNKKNNFAKSQAIGTFRFQDEDENNYKI